MTLLFIGLIILAIGFFAKGLSSKVNIRMHCADIGLIHVWIYKELDHGNSYLVCKNCKHLPGGDREEEHHYQHPEGG